MVLKPSTVIRTGVAVSVGAATAIVAVPWILQTFVYQYAAEGQDFWIATSIVLQVIRELIVPLGVVLIGSGLVMLYLEQRGMAGFHDRAEAAAEDATEGHLARPMRSSSHRFRRRGDDHTT